LKRQDICLSKAQDFSVGLLVDVSKSFFASFLKIGFFQKKTMEFNEEALNERVILHNANNVKILLLGRE
jgi:hypothetical protein